MWTCVCVCVCVCVCRSIVGLRRRVSDQGSVGTHLHAPGDYPEQSRHTKPGKAIPPYPMSNGLHPPCVSAHASARHAKAGEEPDMLSLHHTYFWVCSHKESCVCARARSCAYALLHVRR